MTPSVPAAMLTTMRKKFDAIAWGGGEVRGPDKPAEWLPATSSVVVVGTTNLAT